MTDVPFVTTGAYPVRAGNVVRPLIDGEPAFRRVCDAIEQAQASVWITVTFLWATFQMPDGRGSFFDVLTRACRRGLDVRVLFWRLIASSGRPWWLYATVRRLGWFSGVESDRSMRRILAVIGVVLVIIATVAR
jgi:cardiolipin synthase A/B